MTFVSLAKQILAKLVIIFFLLFVAGYVNEFGASLVADWVQLVDVHRLIEWLPPLHLTFDLP